MWSLGKGCDVFRQITPTSVEWSVNLAYQSNSLCKLPVKGSGETLLGTRMWLEAAELPFVQFWIRLYGSLFDRKHQLWWFRENQWWWSGDNMPRHLHSTRTLKTCGETRLMDSQADLSSGFAMFTGSMSLIHVGLGWIRWKHVETIWSHHMPRLVTT